MMKFLYDIIGKVIAKDHVLYTDIFDVTDTMNVVNSIISIYRNEVKVYCCRWADSPRTWAIQLKATDKEWSKIVNRLNVMRIWSVRGIPSCIMRGVYSTD